MSKSENSNSPTPEELAEAQAKAKAAAEKAAAGKTAVPTKKAKPSKAPTEGMTTVSVIGPAAGRRRAGMSFGKEPVTVEVTDEQLALLEDDPLLSVSPQADP